MKIAQMKIATMLLTLLMGITAFAQTVTTVQDGSFYSPSTWSCNCVPGLTQPLTIAHHVTYDMETEFIAPVVITSAGSLTAVGPVILESSVSMDLQGAIHAHMFGFINTFTISGVLTAVNELHVVGNMVMQGGQVSIGNDLIMIGTGSISGQGSICFGGTGWNSDGSITGEIDICDTSPVSDPPYIGGDVASSVTWCAFGACSVGIDDHATAAYTVSANGDVLTLQSTAGSDGSWEIFDTGGRSLATGRIPPTDPGGAVSIPISSIPAGIHLLRIIGRTGETSHSFRFVRDR